MTGEVSCRRCGDFHWIPVAVAPDWYERDWRILLDPTIDWRPCPACDEQRPVRMRLQESLTRMVILRIEEQVDAWSERGGWRHGLAADGQVVWRHGRIYCLPPGLLADLDGWTMVSELGILRSQTREEIGYHCRRAGLPPVPEGD